MGLGAADAVEEGLGKVDSSGLLCQEGFADSEDLGGFGGGGGKG